MSELVSFIAENISSAFSALSKFQVGEFNLLSFLVILVILDVIVSIFIINLKSNNDRGDRK